MNNPALWQLIQDKGNEQMITEKGIYTFSYQGLTKLHFKEYVSMNCDINIRFIRLGFS